MTLPDRIAAVPDYIQSDTAANFADAAPGHRFQIYFRNWQGVAGSPFTAYRGKVRLGQGLSRDQKRADEEMLKRHFDETLSEVCVFGPSARQQVKALRKRQSEIARVCSGKAWSRLATSTAPFATGLGNEHPIENGFSFLTPYGLPYLAGSGLKGVLRRSAEALVVESPETGWTWLDVWWLFGFEGAAGSIWDAGTEANQALERDISSLKTRSDLHDFIAVCVKDKSERARFLDLVQDRRTDFLRRLIADKAWRQAMQVRGALDCWDVFPEPAENRSKRVEMVVEIMTPHQTKYYEGKESPHDAGQPNPISFLAIPAGAAFDLHVICQVGRLPAGLTERWSELLDAAAAHAFAWLGFGAKTAVGYGAMEEGDAGRAQREQLRLDAQAETEKTEASRKLANLKPEDREHLQNLASIEVFKTLFDAARKRTFEAGGNFSQERLKFMNQALEWTESRSRTAAGETLRTTFNKTWGMPSKQDAKQRLLEAVALLIGPAR